MGDYIYECHGDFFDAWDDHVAAQEGHKLMPSVRVSDCEDERKRNIRTLHDFNANVAALEESRYAVQTRCV